MRTPPSTAPSKTRSRTSTLITNVVTTIPLVLRGWKRPLPWWVGASPWWGRGLCPGGWALRSAGRVLSAGEGAPWWEARAGRRDGGVRRCSCRVPGRRRSVVRDDVQDLVAVFGQLGLADAADGGELGQRGRALG